MQLTGITGILRESGAYQDGLAALKAQGGVSLNAIRAARPLVIAALAQDWPGPVIVLTAQVRRSYNIAEQLPVWVAHDSAVQQPPAILTYAEPTAPFYERVPWVESVIRSRVETLAALLEDTGEKPHPVVVASARALMQRTIPVNQFRRGMVTLHAGQRWPVEKLLAQFVAAGYEPTSLVVDPGTFSRRGGVVDIFPAAMPAPIRIDFFDDEIDTLRVFDPTTQRSESRLDRVLIPPAREALPEQAVQVGRHLAEWFGALPPARDDMTTPIADADSLASGVAFPYLEHYLPYMYGGQPVSLLNYAADDALIILDDPDALQEMIEELAENAARAREEQVAAGLLPPDYPQPYSDWEMLQAALEGRTVLRLGRDTDAGRFGALFTPGGRFGGQLRPMLADARQKCGAGERVVVVSQQAARMRDLWQEEDVSAFAPMSETFPEAPSAGAIVFVSGVLHEGWSLHVESGAVHLFTDAEIFGWNRPEPRRRKSGVRRRPPESDYADWSEGDYVVHVDYGIGRFGGMANRTIEGTEREYLVVRYEGTDMLYVPIHQADRLTRYIGADGAPPKLHPLGRPAEWTRLKGRAKKAVEEEARELLALYAARSQAQGHAFAEDAPWQHELEASFPYVETDDQMRSVQEVKADMEAKTPMDRLICGDVGYGKTEVALRAAFKAVMDGKQVALLVPTTVLAQQHYETFSSRLSVFPIKMALLSRFRSKAEQDYTLPHLASGDVDIVIGTHRILSDDITFKDLGLVIIDEEQRFGVKHKEHFKRLRTQVDVLTLTATPIPRTLYMSLAGVRDISMIHTPPEERLPVVTHVGKFDRKLTRQAIMREIERGGQVFFVHNRVQSIERMRDELEAITPEARIAVAHGQMHGRTLEKIMAGFARGEYDVLLSTAIIESGIDIPNANTLIVDRADWFGMAQLYQLRGRVGRSAQQAFAYFFHPVKMTEDARERLDTLAEYTALGAGFQVAMKDLELRGAGDILSTRQTGHVAAVGLRLYTQMLSRAIRTLKGDAKDDPSPVSETVGVVLDLPVPAYIPTDWLPEIALRLQIYRRIAGLTTPQEVGAMRDELHDRFGQLPKAVDGLLYQIEVKLLAQRANATHVLVRVGRVRIRLPYLGEVNRDALAHDLGDDNGDVEVSRTEVSLPYAKDDGLWQLRLLDILSALAGGISPTI